MADEPVTSFIPSGKAPECEMSWPSQEGTKWQIWTSGRFYMRTHPPGNRSWRRGESRYNPDLPHAVVTIHDMARPLGDDLLRSELLMPVCLLKAQIRWPSMYLGHQVCPVLVVNFPSRFSARILQAYFQNGKVVIRPSRLINLYTRTISPEVRLVIRWLNSRPVGDTRKPIPATEQLDDNATLPVEVPDVPDILSPMIPAK
ncbi:hypothetical protein LCI18_000888 [Fusarium solani-melongenae]|uniref:Uncharacterized protein n=1 Tax=Fusarium solani subsp. cucurbitae TaxID=2747967 RepID=A0ACD3YM53_FUSSC|nr:hypothetical protein LCI18_000888 [Fusarium solani-melongenae]